MPSMLSGPLLFPPHSRPLWPLIWVPAQPPTPTAPAMGLSACAFDPYFLFSLQQRE